MLREFLQVYTLKGSQPLNGEGGGFSVAEACSLEESRVNYSSCTDQSSDVVDC